VAGSAAAGERSDEVPDLVAEDIRDFFLTHIK
jgi:hypothetical protein